MACHENQNQRCSACGLGGDLRPYGPDGTWICFHCATGTPEANTSAREQFLSQLEASGPVAILDGTNVGPYPARQFKERTDGE